jgi:ABC-type uncharacterized transport system substrate-binding protein
VFTYCSDPVAAGAGKSFTNHLAHVTGVGSFPPVQDMVDFIRKVLPGAKTIGTIYNASEANSVKVVQVARGLFAAAGLKLDEVTVTSSGDVLQAAQALVSRRVDAIYIQGDNTVNQGFDAVVKAARDASLPLLVDDPDTAKRGALACVGLGYYQPGYAIAKPLARVLLGESPAGIPIENVSEKIVWLDLPQAEKLGVKFPAEIITEAARGATTNVASKPAVDHPPLARKAKIELIEYLETPNVEINREGVLAGLEKAGLKRGRDFELRIRNASGDMATLNTIVDASVADGADVLITAATPGVAGRDTPRQRPDGRVLARRQSHARRRGQKRYRSSAIRYRRVHPRAARGRLEGTAPVPAKSEARRHIVCSGGGELRVLQGRVG